MIMQKYILAAVLTSLLSGAVGAERQQILPDRLPTLPVRIEIPTGTNRVRTGTGMLLTESNKVFLVTAAHVLFNLESSNRLELLNRFGNLTAYGRSVDSITNVTMTMDFEALRNGGRVMRHPSHDVAVILAGFWDQKSTNGLASAQFNYCAGPLIDGFQFTSFPTSVCTRFKDLQGGSDVYILGYPSELLKNQMRSEVDFSVPLIRRGIVSQLNQGTGKLIIDSGVYGGNSGGPIFVVERSPSGISFKLAGLITQFVPVFTRTAPQIGLTNSFLVNSGYGVAEPMDYALELMRQ